MLSMCPTTDLARSLSIGDRVQLLDFLPRASPLGVGAGEYSRLSSLVMVLIMGTLLTLPANERPVVGLYPARFLV